MKGLLIKDLYLVKGYGTSIILISALFIAIGIMNGSYAFLMLTALYSAMISINTMSYDERGHWDTYADSLPVSRTQVVLSKYILSFIAMLIVWILYLAGQTIAGVCSGTGVSAHMLSMSLILWSSWGFMVALLYPVLFRFGMEKGRVLYMLAIMVISGVSGIFLSIKDELDVSITVSDITPYTGIAACVIVLSAALVTISVLLSIHFYGKRDL